MVASSSVDLHSLNLSRHIPLSYLARCMYWVSISRMVSKHKGSATELRFSWFPFSIEMCHLWKNAAVKRSTGKDNKDT
jgi:hypothetical protein